MLRFSMSSQINLALKCKIRIYQNDPRVYLFNIFILISRRSKLLKVPENFSHIGHNWRAYIRCVSDYEWWDLMIGWMLSHKRCICVASRLKNKKIWSIINQFLSNIYIHIAIEWILLLLYILDKETELHYVHRIQL